MNAPRPMVADFGIVMAVALVQPKKAPSPMQVTESGIVMAVALEQRSKRP